jgi:dolichol-phosphate mannosyltransferase
VTEISVVIPVYNCAGCLPALHERLSATLSALTSDYEIVLVDDRSRDDAWAVMSELARADGRLRIVRLSRNFGQHAAITAGLTRARGDWTVVMDCDLQEPPEEIARLWAKAQEGYDVVRATREGRRHSAFRRLSASLYRRMLSEREGGGEIEFSTLSMISRKVVDAFLQLRDRDREYQLVLDWLGFSQATISFAHAERAGESPSAYGLRELVGVALDGMFFRTTVLLRWIVLLGFVVALAGFSLGAYAVFARIVEGGPPGYTSIVVLLVLLSGVILISLGVVGLYVGRIFDQVKGRPLFVVDEQIDGDAPPR